MAEQCCCDARMQARKHMHMHTRVQPSQPSFYAAAELDAGASPALTWLAGMGYCLQCAQMQGVCMGVMCVPVCMALSCMYGTECAGSRHGVLECCTGPWPSSPMAMRCAVRVWPTCWHAGTVACRAGGCLALLVTTALLLPGAKYIGMCLITGRFKQRVQVASVVLLDVLGVLVCAAAAWWLALVTFHSNQCPLWTNWWALQWALAGWADVSGWCRVTSGGVLVATKPGCMLHL